MEDLKPRPGAPSDRAQVAAEKLRALRQRANEALEDHRRRLAQIESELSLRVRQLSEEFESASANVQRRGWQGRDDEVAALRRQLEEGRAKHEKFVEQLAVARRQLDAIQNQPCPACHDAAQQLADAHGEIRQLREKLDAADRQRHEDRLRQDKFATQIAEARQALNELQSRTGSDAAQFQSEKAGLTAEFESARLAQKVAEDRAAALERELAAMAAEQGSLQSASKKAAEEHAVALENLRREADAAADGLKSRITALEADLESSRHVRGDSEAKLTQLKTQLAEARGDNEALAKERDQWQRQKADLDAALAEARAAAQTEHQTQSAALATAEGRNAELESRLAAIESDKSALTASLAETNEKIAAANESLAAAHRQIETLEASTADRGELARQLEDVRKTLAAREKATRDLQASLDEAKQELAAANEQTCPRSELSELQHKFDIALADVQKLKQENAALRDELASRPATSDADSPELIALRSEREALESRVAELEKAAQAAADATSQQDFEDLERRFEMAVDDVRELKQENAQLRDQIAKSKPDGAAAAHSGPFDWAAQKARLLAALAEEEGAGPMDGERKKERLSIQKTIEATDRLIAEKERQIAELHANQLQADSRVPTGPSREEAAKELLDADELVSQERLRLGKLQSECEEKMRAAELELSVERAKLAREQALLKERLFELQKLTPKGDADDALGKPRRRWLSALGLGDDGDDQGKKQA